MALLGSLFCLVLLVTFAVNSNALPIYGRWVQAFEDDTPELDTKPRIKLMLNNGQLSAHSGCSHLVGEFNLEDSFFVARDLQTFQRCGSTHYLADEFMFKELGKPSRIFAQRRGSLSLFSANWNFPLSLSKRKRCCNSGSVRAQSSHENGCYQPQTGCVFLRDSNNLSSNSRK